MHASFGSFGIYSRFTVQSALVHWKSEPIPDWITISGSAITMVAVPVPVSVQEPSNAPVSARDHEEGSNETYPERITIVRSENTLESDLFVI